MDPIADHETALDQMHSQYIDILAAYGSNSKEARAFERTYATTPEIAPLLASTRALRTVFASGMLRPVQQEAR